MSVILIHRYKSLTGEIAFKKFLNNYIPLSCMGGGGYSFKAVFKTLNQYYYAGFISNHGFTNIKNITKIKNVFISCSYTNSILLNNT